MVWIRYFTQEGDPYFYNDVTELTQWEQPTEEVYDEEQYYNQQEESVDDTKLITEVSSKKESLGGYGLPEKELEEIERANPTTANSVPATVSSQRRFSMKSRHEFPYEVNGEKVWIPDDIEMGFIPASIKTLYSNGQLCLINAITGEQIIYKKARSLLLPRLEIRVTDPSHTEDLVHLDAPNDGEMLETIRCRFLERRIYVRVSNILVVTNPFEAVPLYTPVYLEKYMDSQNVKRMAPHVFQIAAEAYNTLRENQKPQSIVVSGESGAGKTESTKHCLQYLAEVAGSDAQLEQRILLANPLLESLGNAKTSRNNNSSRFGKYMEIQFGLVDEKPRIVAATIQHYLLERVRVNQQTSDERNYHIFYQFVAGASEDERKQFGLHERVVSNYEYLRRGASTIENVDDKADFSDVAESMNRLGFSKQDKEFVYSCVAATLHLGNIKTSQDGSSSDMPSSQQIKSMKSRNDSSYCSITGDSPSVQFAAKLMGVNVDELVRALTVRKMEIRGQDLTMIPLKVEESEKNRESLAKHVYCRLFDWLVWRINKSLAADENMKYRKFGTIGVLDVFGFEIFGFNSFEQLLINWTNERLQALFNQHTFALEEKLYQVEGIQFDKVMYIDNQPILDLISSRPDGIVTLIDDEVRLPRGSDKGLLDKLNRKHGACGSPRKSKSSIFRSSRKSPENFILAHYAGDVEYCVTGFLAKSADRLGDDLHSVLETSTHMTLRPSTSIEASTKTSSELEKPEKPTRRRKSGMRSSTVGSKFNEQLDSLTNTLTSTSVHYVRCLKPNQKKIPGLFDGALVLHQMRCSGILDSVRIRRAGFPFRLAHTDFRHRYRCCFLGMDPEPSEPQDMINTLLSEEQAQKIQLGKTMVLYRASEHGALEQLRDVAVDRLLIKLQALTRGFQTRAAISKYKCTWLSRLQKVQTMDTIDELLAQWDSELESRLGSNLAALYQARDLRRRLQKQIDVKAAILKLLEQDGHAEEREWCAAVVQEVAAAEELGLGDTSYVIQARQRQEALAQRRAWLGDWKHLVNIPVKEIAPLKELVNRFHDVPWADASKPDDKYEKAKDLLERAQKEWDSLLELEIKCVDVDQILHLDEFQHTELSTTALRLGVKWLAALVEFRNCRNAAMGSREKENWIALSGALDVLASNTMERENSTIRQDVPEAQHATQIARQEVDAALNDYRQFLETDAVAHLLHQAIEQVDFNMLTKGLQQAHLLGMDEHSAQTERGSVAGAYPIVTSAYALHQHLITIRSKLQIATDYVDPDGLRDALNEASSCGYAAEDPVGAAHQLWEALDNLRQRAIVQVELLEPEKMTEIVQSAGKYCYTMCAEITELGRLLFETPEDRFLQLQLRAAVRNNHQERALAVTIRVKELFLARHADMFALHLYPRLRTASEYASRKSFVMLSASKREELELSFLKWTSTPTHTSLTRSNHAIKGYEKKAKTAFKTLLSYMGDRANGGNSSTDPLFLARDFVALGTECPELRAEIYCQLIKQLSSNPSNASRIRGWQLMSLCMESYPPPDDYLNYFECWLRDQPQPEAYVARLHESVLRAEGHNSSLNSDTSYGAAHIPTVDHISDTLRNKKSTGRRAHLATNGVEQSLLTPQSNMWQPPAPTTFANELESVPAVSNNIFAPSGSARITSREAIMYLSPEESRKRSWVIPQDAATTSEEHRAAIMTRTESSTALESGHFAVTKFLASKPPPPPPRPVI